MGKADPDRQANIAVWEETFGSPPPAYLSVDFMLRAIAHEEQCRSHGGLPDKFRRELRSIATFDDIAKTSDTSKRRIQQMIGLAFLAPDIVRMVMDGDQPAGFTSDWCKRNILPSDWVEQRAIIAAV